MNEMTSYMTTAPAKAGTPNPEPSDSRKALVRELTETVREARRFWAPIFERMREDMAFACGDQWHDSLDKMSDKYQVNFIPRTLNQQVSALYARNPTFTAERRERLEYQVWDGTQGQLEQAKAAISQAGQSDLQASQMGGQPQGPPAEASAIVQDYAHGLATKQMLERIAQTLELLLAYEMDEQVPEFESQMKDLLLCEKTAAAGFVTVKFQSEHEQVLTQSATQASLIGRLQEVAALTQKLNDDPSYGDQSACHEQLRLLVAGLQQALQQGDSKVLSQGIVIDFKPPSSIIVDPKCRSLIGFVGADYIVEEFMLTPEQVEEVWQRDVKKSGSVVQYQHGEEQRNTVNLRTKAGGEERERATSSGPWPEKAQVCVWIIQHKRDQMKYVLCDGFDDFLEEPAAPWPAVKGFWHTVALKLTRVIVDENKPQLGVTIYGQSAARLLRPMQEEMNRSQEALREHRVANRPGHICGKDTFSSTDRMNLAGRSAHAVIPLENVPPGGDCSKVLVPIPTVTIDERLYRTDGVMQHALLVTGVQQANMGEQQANEKATGQAIAEQSRVQSVNNESDSQDKFLANVGQIMAEMLLQAMDPKVVKEKVGPGAVWPVSTQQREAVRKHLYTVVDAGSTGRPNAALEVAKMKDSLPMLIQLAQSKGLPIDPLVRHMAHAMDLKFDIDEWLAQAQPPQQGPQSKPASEAISIKLADLTPEERAQALLMAGIKPSPQGPPPPPAAAGQPEPGQATPGLPAGIAAQTTRMLPK